jgi:hypothetical protein
MRRSLTRWLAAGIIVAGPFLMGAEGCETKGGVVDKAIEDKSNREEKKGKPRLVAIRLVSNGSSDLVRIAYTVGDEPAGAINAFRWQGDWDTVVLVEKGTVLSMVIENEMDVGYVRCQILAKGKVVVAYQARPHEVACSHVAGERLSGRTKK